MAFSLVATYGSRFDGVPGGVLDHGSVQRVDVVKDLLARRVPPLADRRPDVEPVQAPTLRERS